LACSLRRAFSDSPKATQPERSSAIEFGSLERRQRTFGGSAANTGALEFVADASVAETTGPGARESSGESVVRKQVVALQTIQHALELAALRFAKAAPKLGSEFDTAVFAPRQQAQRTGEQACVASRARRARGPARFHRFKLSRLPFPFRVR
jgi:hypothetical protein